MQKYSTGLLRIVRSNANFCIRSLTSLCATVNYPPGVAAISNGHLWAVSKSASVLCRWWTTSATDEVFFDFLRVFVTSHHISGARQECDSIFFFSLPCCQSNPNSSNVAKHDPHNIILPLFDHSIRRLFFRECLGIRHASRNCDYNKTAPMCFHNHDAAT